MALINCPECGKQISDKAPACIHCGCPLNFKSKKIIRYGKPVKSIKTESIFKETFPQLGWEALYAGQEYVIVDGVTENFAEDVLHKFSSTDLQLGIDDSCEEVQYASYRDRNIISCPKCGSIEYNAGSRGFSVMTGFIGSGKTVITCLKCGPRRKPGK